MKNRWIVAGLFGGVAVIVGLCYALNSPEAIKDYVEVGTQPKISPDYSDIVIPANIAPLNFTILEEGQRYFTRIHAGGDESISIFSKTSQIQISPRKWWDLLISHRGRKVFFEVYVMNAKKEWRKFQSISNTIAEQDIDGTLVYRRMLPIYNWWKDIGIYQRDLATFDESLVMHGRSFNGGCLNCHSFVGNDPGTMTIGLRSASYGSSTLLARDGEVRKIGAKWGYTAWHPNGKLAVYSINKVRQFFHAGRMEVRDVIDLDSALVCYKVEEQKAISPPPLSDKNRLETYPTWSPDGQWLYFCSGPILWEDRNKVPPVNYNKLKYDLCRVHYDAQTNHWGDVETVLSAEKTGLSIMLPRISPDGRFLLFCMCEYGCFPIYQASSDLYMMNLLTHQYHKLTINSPYSESWHSWSSNNRWIAFSSRRRDGRFTRTYLSYVDRDGTAHKPFILPQRDPTYYDSQLETFSVPELISSPVKVGQRALARAARSDDCIGVDVPITGATPKTKGSDPWQERE
ncbi:MAG: PD40 domain-containing protein [Sedimentisphaerales bacterium]|nr:PD40 domain-containing protein [Sedimentisphaerales bacterium]